MRLSVIIPSWNDLPRLRNCLTALRRQELPRDEYELIIVDDGSSDQTAVWLEQQPDIRAVVLDHNQGRAAARNAGLRLAAGEQVVFLDADLTVPEHYLTAQLAQADPDLVQLGQVRFARETGRTGFQKYMETRGAWKHRDGSELPPRYFVTCNAMVPRRLLDLAGGFDERFRYWGGEDMDLGIRLAECGARFRFNKEAIAYHHQQRSFATHLVNLKIFGEHNLPLLLEHHPQLARELQVDLLRPGDDWRWRRLFLRSGLTAPTLLLLGLGEKALRGRGLPDKLYDLAIFLATVNGFTKRSEGGTDN